MKILYLTPIGNRKDFFQNKEFNLTETSTLISNGIKEKFKNAEISLPRDIITNEGFIIEENISKFDLYLCDLTTANPSVSFAAGMIEGLRKPIIYFISNEAKLITAVSNKNHLIYSEASLKGEFQSELNEIIKEAIDNPNKFKSFSSSNATNQKAFISYSHNDKEYLKRLLVHLKPLEKKGLLDIWEDSKIKIGDKWEDKINKALTSANIAILLISADFMASDFIVENELPPLLSKAEIKGTKIIPIIISPCRFSREPSLNRFQAANSPDKPLSLIDDSEREIIYDKVSAEIESALRSE
jgi:hypothetical protein